MANVVEIDVKANDRTRGFAGIREGLSQALSGLGGIAVAAGADLAASLAGPLVAATGATVAAFASAGAAVGAFGLAVAPQLKQVTDLTADLSTLPPATREAAVAFRGLRGDFMKWSDSLSSSTMPVFTKGFGVLRTLLPSLTPLVKAGAEALSGFMDTLQRDAQGGGIARFTAKLADAARKVLPDLLSSLRNVAIGFGGIVSAFLPFADDMSGGLESLTKKFADFGQSLGDNQAFQDFMAKMADEGPGLLELLGNLAEIVGNVAEAMAPFSGVTLKVTEALAKFVAAIPQDVMNWLAPTITGIVIAIRAWAVVQGVLNVLLAANPLGLVVLALAALAGGLIYAYKHSETFRRLVDKAFSVIKEKGGEMWDRIKPGLDKMVEMLRDNLPEAAAFLAESIDDLAQKAQDVSDKVLGIKDKITEGDIDKEGTFASLKDLWDDVVKGAGKAMGAVRKFRQVMDRLNGKTIDVIAKVAGTGPVQKLIGWVHRLNGKIVRVAASVFGSKPIQTLIKWVGRLNGKIVRVGASVWGSGAVQGLINKIRNLTGKVVNVGANIFGFASGGISHAAEGGPRGNLALVGERGPEIVRLPQGSQVYPTGQSMGMLGQMGGGGVARVQLEWVGGRAGDAFMDWLKENIRIKGGSGPDSVQRALG